MKTKPMFSIKRVLIAFLVLPTLALLLQICSMLDSGRGAESLSHLLSDLACVTIAGIPSYVGVPLEIAGFAVGVWLLFTSRSRVWMGLGVVLSMLPVLLCLLWRESHPQGRSPGISTRTQIADIDKAINIYAMQHNGQLPDALSALVESDDPLLNKPDLIDRWGEPFGYERNGRRYIIRSSGPDRIMGTEDDITN